jgi:amino acid adenylation domain-containing protein
MMHLAYQPIGIPDLHQPLMARFEQIVAQFSDQIAVVAENALTYQVLNQRSNQLAQAILAQDNDPKAVVTILGGQQTKTIVAMLAALKIGRIFTVLDPKFPPERLRYIYADSGSELIITGADHFDLVTKLGGKHTPILDIEAIAAFGRENIGKYLPPETPAAIYYTSGSTGKPKGILCAQNYYLFRSYWFAKTTELTLDDRAALLFLASYGMASNQIFGTLLNGARLCLFDPNWKGLNELVSWLHQEQISIFNPPAPLFQVLVRTDFDKDQFESVRLVYVGGQPIYKQDLDHFWEQFPGTCRFIHTYGSTEASQISAYPVARSIQLEKDVLPVGYPDQDVRVVDVAGHPVDEGQEGEIVVSGPYIAYEYWHKPDQTAGAFQTDPVDPKVRRFFTGDRGRFRLNGILENLGRIDFMVKILGYRVELNEIEAAILKNPSIQQAVVLAHDQIGGDKQLVAYLKLLENSEADISQLRQFLQKCLPDYMIPAAYVIIDQFEMTTTGKIDRQALPTPVRVRPDIQTAFVPPKTAMELAVSEIWITVLALDRIGVHDNFFELGGHSIQATQIVSRIQTKLNVNLPLVEIFQKPTIAEVAATLDSLEKSARGNQKPAIKSLSREQFRRKNFDNAT